MSERYKVKEQWTEEGGVVALLIDTATGKLIHDPSDGQICWFVEVARKHAAELNASAADAADAKPMFRVDGAETDWRIIHRDYSGDGTYEWAGLERDTAERLAWVLNNQPALAKLVEAMK